MLASPPASNRLSKEAERLQAFAVINGQQQPVRVGDVIAEGRLVGEGEQQFCDTPDISYGLKGSTAGIASITLDVTSDCRVVVSAIDVGPTVVVTSGSGSMKPDGADTEGERSFETHGPDSD